MRLAAAVAALQDEAGGGMRGESLGLPPVSSRVADLLDPASVAAAGTTGAALDPEDAVAPARGLAGHGDA